MWCTPVLFVIELHFDVTLEVKVVGVSTSVNDSVLLYDADGVDGIFAGGQIVSEPGIVAGKSGCCKPSLGDMTSGAVKLFSLLLQKHDRPVLYGVPKTSLPLCCEDPISASLSFSVLFTILSFGLRVSGEQQFDAISVSLDRSRYGMSSFSKLLSLGVLVFVIVEEVPVLPACK
jgi:hypothetical protein